MQVVLTPTILLPNSIHTTGSDQLKQRLIRQPSWETSPFLTYIIFFDLARIPMLQLYVRCNGRVWNKDIHIQYSVAPIDEKLHGKSLTLYDNVSRWLELVRI